ncbi:hypothetical protein AVEN_60600-1 [Araneus ventricosus]|uniref:BTB domain-containing protein n=1 Tax=Araneus ventricosus TaxID=182803 RepID=A0A4Y2WVP3_ARAVE|nr:hypothetical protein AVEN_60600-1 [Araneus ventricosus]
MILRTLLQVGWPSMVARIVSNRAPHLLRPPLFISMGKSNYFTYVSALENVNIFYHRSVKSPSFKLPSVESEWCIELCLQDKDEKDLISSKLLRRSYVGFVEVNDMDYELSLLASDGSCQIERNFSSSKDKTRHGLYVPRDEVLVRRKNAFLPNNTLTLQYEMRLSKVVHCFARTRLRIEKVSLRWLIEDFSSSDENSKYAQKVRSASFENSVICTQIFRTSCCEEKLNVKFTSSVTNDNDKSDDDKRDDDDSDDDRNSDAIDCYTCEMSLSDALGKEECILDETRFDFNKEGKITLPLTRSMLMEEPSKYLTNGVLSLNCLLTFYSSASMEEIKSTKYGNSDRFFKEDEDKGASTLKDDLRSLYDDHSLCDFTIQTETKLFSVHKSILISRSPIFRSMIMNCVKRDSCVSDVDSETMHRFLLYLHTDKVEDMEWENAMKLFVVAEQFKMPTLMKKFSLILTEKLTIRNVCDILLLAYKHHDEDMKSSIRDFISVHDVAIFNSDKWIKMEETNSSIAAKTAAVISKKRR